MRAGELDQRITLQNRSVTQDTFGQDITVWVDVLTVWAQVQALRGREFFAAAQVQQEKTLKVRIRYRSDVSPTWRFIWQGRVHDITSVIPVGRKEMLELMCHEGVNP